MPQPCLSVCMHWQACKQTDLAAELHRASEDMGVPIMEKGQGDEVCRAVFLESPHGIGAMPVDAGSLDRWRSETQMPNSQQVVKQRTLPRNLTSEVRELQHQSSLVPGAEEIFCPRSSGSACSLPASS